jgi:hypothetical protein
MRKLVCIVVLCVIAAAAFGEESAVVPEYHLRLGQSEVFGFGGKLAHSWGIGAEYGIRDWLNVQFLWNRYLKITPNIGSGSAFMGAKVYVVGDAALLQTNEKFRLSAALGMLAPATGENDWMDQDQNLWGTTLRLYGDYIINQYVYINLFIGHELYPPQYQNDDVAAYRDWVGHYIDYTFELEGHFQYPLDNGYTLKAGIPIRYFFAPYMNNSDALATSQYFFSMGVYFGFQLPDREIPFEVYLKYDAKLFGQNVKQVHQLSLIHKVILPPEALKFRLKSRMAQAGEPTDSEQVEMRNEEIEE